MIVVFGGTGSQGGSVVRALLRRGAFRVRFATRKPDCAKARELIALGAEPVAAAYNDPASLDVALRGAYGAWFITSFWDAGKGTVEAEVELGRNVAAAAANNGVKHLMYSTLESPAVMGAGFAFPTFDAKIGVEQEILFAGVPFTFVQVAYYFNNMENNNPNPHAGWYPWRKSAAGKWLIQIPIHETYGLHAIHNEDVGEPCAAMFEQPQRFIGKKVALSAERITPQSLLLAFQTAFPGQQFEVSNPAIEEYRDLSSQTFGDALYLMYKWYQYRTPRGGDIELTKELHPGVLSLVDYLRAHSDRFHWNVDAAPTA